MQTLNIARIVLFLFMDKIKDKDKRRIAYYKYYTDRKWADAKNYQLCLDSGVLGIDKCVELIEKAM